MKLARVWRCCCGFDVVVALAILAGIVAAAVPVMADPASARRGALAASMISLGNAGGSYNIHVSLAGTGFGSVTDDIGEISCGGDCLGEYFDDDVVTLTATAAPGSYFTGWSGGGCSGTGDCQITITDSGAFVVATFELNPNVDVDFVGSGSGSVEYQPGGTVCSNDCGNAFPPGTEVTLTATAAPGSYFAGWSGGGCSGTGPCVITLDTFGVLVDALFETNSSPTALCRDVTIDARASCVSLFIAAEDVDNGSSDPDDVFGDEIALSLDFSGPFPIGQTLVTLTVTDLAGATSTCTATVTVLANDCNTNGVPDVCDIGEGNALDCDGNGIPDDCECFWCNVRPDIAAGGKGAPQPDVNAQLSHLGGGTPCGEKVADDFYLEPGCVHRITAVRGKLLTNSNPNLRRARVELYEDCNGAPVDVPFFTADYNNPEDDAIASEVLSVVPAADGFSVVTYRFNLCDEHLWLEGGKTYWVSIIGLTDNVDMVDLSYWIAGSEFAPMLGNTPVKRTGTPGSTWGSCDFGPWESIEDCCIGCVNMDFCIDGYACPILWHNGKVDLVDRGGSPSGAHQQYHDRTADNFVVKTCRDEHLCLIEAWIWTNCEPVHGFIEIYEGQGCDPLLGDAPWAIWNGDSIDAKRFDETLVVNGRTHHLWRLRVKDPGLTLTAGRNYWISAGAVSTGNFNSNSFFAWSKYGCNPCNGTDTFRITPGQHRTLRPPATEWAEVIPARDFAFKIAVRGAEVIPPDDNGPPDQGLGTPACLADANNDGNVAVDDIFAFLSAWFVGCP